MEMKKILVAVALATLATSAQATYWGWYSHNHNCGDDGGGSDCVVTWDFTKTARDLGDPITYDANNPYSLAIEGFSIVREAGDKEGMIMDAPREVGTKNGEYATDYDGSQYGLGVHSTGEDTHWGTKIDNLKNDMETWYVRDAVLMDFGSCLVSLDELVLKKAYDTADRDYEVWAFSGEIDNKKSLEQLGNYNGWETDADFELVDSVWNGSGWDKPWEITDKFSSDITSRYFILIAGANQGNNNDAFRISSLSVNCDINNCDPGNNGETPVPGTLALLAIGALATRRQLRLARRR